MFDAKSILEAMVTGGRGSPTGGTSSGGLNDILGQIMKQQGGGSGQTGAGGLPGGLEDLVRNMMGGSGSPPQSAGQGGSSSTSDNSAGGGFTDMMKDILGGNDQAGKSRSGGGGIGDILSEALGQAKDGVKEGAGKINETTGAGDAISDLMRQVSGKSPEELVSQLQDLIANNKLGAGAALGGLGALVLGTRTGRSIAVNAAKIGALALIGGLAYKAYKNYQDGSPTSASGDTEAEPAPSGSGFEPDAVSNDDAALLVRTMLAAAAADGRVDSTEQDRIIGSLKQSGLDDGAEEFIADALNNPISIDSIVGAVSTKQQAVQVYTAARIAIDPDTYGEKAFLSELAEKLGIDSDLVAHINAASLGATA